MQLRFSIVMKQLSNECNLNNILFSFLVYLICAWRIYIIFSNEIFILQYFFIGPGPKLWLYKLD